MIRSNIYNRIPNSVFTSNYLPIQPNSSTIDSLKNFVSQLKLGNDQGLSLGGIDEDKKQIKDIEKFNKVMEPIAFENEKFEQQEAYNNSILGKVDNTLNNFFNSFKDIIGFSIDSKLILFAIIILIIIIKI